MEPSWTTLGRRGLQLDRLDEACAQDSPLRPISVLAATALVRVNGPAEHGSGDVEPDDRERGGAEPDERLRFGRRPFSLALTDEQS